MAVTRDNILKVCPNASVYVDELLRQMYDADISGPMRSACFLGQIAVESQGFTRTVENLNYSSSALKTLFSRKRISIHDADQFGRRPGHPANLPAIANAIYGGTWGRENLGNTQPGDGYRFRGRGLKQLTGRDNYTRFSHAWLGSDAILGAPERVQEPPGAVASAVWFWKDKNLNSVADSGDVTAVTKIVNGGINGLEDRKDWTRKFLEAFA